MKKILALFLFIAVLLSFASAETESKSLLPFAEVYWTDSRDILAERLDINLDTQPENSIVSSTDFAGLSFAVVYNFSETLDSITVFTDAVGGEVYKPLCAIFYDGLVATLTQHTGVEAIAEDTWSSPAAQSQYSSGDLSLAMWNGDLTRKATINAAEAKYSTAFVLTGNTLNIGYIVEKPGVADVASSSPRHFDIAPFSGSAFDITIDDMENRVFIDSTYSWSDTYRFSHSDSSEYYFSVIYPDVYISDYKGSSETSYFRIWILYNAENWLFADNAIIKCGDKRFTASGIDVDTKVREHGAVQEKLLFRVSASDADFMDAWLEASSVTIRLKGSKGYRDFTVPATAKLRIDEMYKVFKEATGDTWAKNRDYIQ